MLTVPGVGDIDHPLAKQEIGSNNPPMHIGPKLKLLEFKPTNLGLIPL